MSSWDEFISSAKKAFSKAAVKVNDLADTAADSIKIESLKLKLSQKYEELGKIVYNEMKSSTDDSSAEKAADKAAEIDAINSEIEALKAKKEKKRSASEKSETEQKAEENKEETKEVLSLDSSENKEQK